MHVEKGGSMATNLFVMNHELVWEDPDIFAVRIPYAHLGLGHTNCYIIRSEGETLVIDPGVISPAAGRALEKAVDELGVDITRADFLCTHAHFDHAAQLRNLVHQGSKIYLGQHTYENNPYHASQESKDALRNHLKKEGSTYLATRGMAALSSEVNICDLPGCTYVSLKHNDIVTVGAHQFRVIETPGHAMGHICLYSDKEKLLISGDHILESTTPGLAVPLEGQNPLEAYLESVGKVRSLDCKAVLPGHGEAFFALKQRCDALVEHHSHRMGQILDVVAAYPGMNGSDVARTMPWSRSGPFKHWDRLNPYLRLSMGLQTLAYLKYLTAHGELVRSEDAMRYHYHISENK